ncbi:MAG: hypothetical protein K0S89_698 [Nitrososphaeraceae archaeon]|nr:hypothetical protein [Nitrososphaeraceae archaeon]
MEVGEREGVWNSARVSIRQNWSDRLIIIEMATKDKTPTREEHYEYLSKLLSGNGNPMYDDKHINIGRTYRFIVIHTISIMFDLFPIPGVLYE